MDVWIEWNNRPAQDTPPQVPLQLAQHATVLLELGDEAFARDHVIPMFCRSLESFTAPEVILAALKAVPALCAACIIKVRRVSTRVRVCRLGLVRVSLTLIMYHNPNLA
jgi:hypothetical protein